MRKYFLFVIILWFFIFSPTTSLAGPITDSMEQEFNQTLKTEIDKINLNSWDAFLKDIDDTDARITDLTFKDIVVNFATGKTALESTTVFEYIFKTFGSIFIQSLSSIAIIAFVVICSSILNKLDTPSISGISKISNYVCYILIITLLMQSLLFYTQYTKTVIDSLTNATRLIFPPLLTLMVAIGGISSNAIFKPAMVTLSGSMVEYIGSAILPLCLIGGTITLVSGISDKIQLKKLAKLAFSAVKWLLGIGSTVFIGILSLQGMMASSFDGIYLRTAKYAIGSFVPIIGGMVSDTVDTLMGCSLMLKNAVGGAGLILIACVIITPLIRIAVTIFMYKLVAALLETVADKNIIDTISGITHAFTLLFVIILVVGCMTFITISLAISAGNTNMMLR